MSYVLSDSGNNVVAYPYSIGELRRDNPNVSFPANPTDELLAEWYVFPVVNVTPPSFNRLSQDLTEINPVYSEGVWSQQWQVTNVSPTVEAERTAQAEAEANAQANAMLQDAEQYYLDAMIAGYGFSTAMQTYVDTLSSPSTITNYPLVEDMAWPTLPTTILDSNNPDLPVSVYTKAQTDAAIAAGGGGGNTGDIVFEGSKLIGSTGEVRLAVEDVTTTATFTLNEGVDFSTAVWDGTTVTFNDTTQNVYDAIWAVGSQFDIVELNVGGTIFNVTVAGSSTPGAPPDSVVLYINETAVGGPLNIGSVYIETREGTESYVKIDGTDFRVDVQDDVRIYGNDTFILSNRSTTKSLFIETNDEQNWWEFTPEGNLILPNFGDIKDTNGNSVLGGSGDYLPLSGGTMSGQLDMGFQKIVGLANPELEQDAVTKQYVDNNFTPQANFVDAVISAASGSYVPLSGGTMTGELNMGLNSIVSLNNPTQNDHATNKLYVDNAIAGLAPLPRLTINLETDTGNITTVPKIANALTTINSTNGYTINLGFGEYREPGPIVFDNKWQLNVVGVHSANTTGATIKNGITIQNSNGVRLFKVQVEGASSIACRAGLGQQFERSQFMGNVTLSGTGGFMMFTDCEFAGNVTVAANFAGVIYFTRCSFSNASGVYTFSQTSAQQVIISDSTGLPNTQPTKVSYFGNILSKNLVQKFYINNVAINPVGGINGQVLQLTAGEWVPQSLPVTEVTQAELDEVSSTLTGLIAAETTARQAMFLPVTLRDGSVVSISLGE